MIACASGLRIIHRPPKRLRANREANSLRTELKSGDVVEIVTAPGARPNPGWLNFVRTGRARSKIRHFLKTMEHEESRSLGEKLLAQALRAEGLLMPSTELDDTAAQTLWQLLIRWSGSRSRTDLMVDIGLGRKIATIVAKRLSLLMAERGSRPDAHHRAACASGRGVGSRSNAVCTARGRWAAGLAVAWGSR